MASKNENITKAFQHYQDRKIGRDKQIWTHPAGAILVNETIKGAIPKKI